ncbi:hypothetical protein QC764_110160 [Podospora pseudoanserina]|uniref:Cytochrome P450 E-class, group I n=1 Tax=Podospora pseudoanserina TaxID=2609844 RepID=A0ABR0INW0_9PEZI|nr:hypothetical protein QC764_110160 [Podospora pseudoanserina]
MSYKSSMMTMLSMSEHGSLGPMGVLGVALAGSLSIFLLRSIYYAFLHPLSKIPGPKLYSFWDLPYLYHAVRGNWPHKLKDLHDRYGPVVRYTSDNISFTTPSAWKTIYGHRNLPGQETFPKDPTAYRPTPSGHPHIIIASDPDHRRQRRLLSHAFSEKALRAQEDILNHYATLLITKLTAKANAKVAVDIVQWFNFTTFDLIGDLAFGQPFNCLDSAAYHPWVSLIFSNIKLGVFFEVLRRHPFLGCLKTFLLPKHLVKSQKEHRALSEKTAKKRLEAGGTERGDFMSYILRHNDEKGMSEGEIIENSSLLIIAGSETTATQLSGTTFWLLKNRDKYDKLVKEIRGRFGREDEIDLVAVGGLEYLEAVLEEGFRMYPPTPLALPRRVPPKGEYIEGYWIPGNTSVAVPQWASYQSSSNFRDPQKFVPERWLGDPRYADDVRGVLQPFSVGPRNCIGRNLAYAEMRLIMARLLWNFDLELMPESEEWNRQRIYVLWEKGAVNVRLTPVVR